MTIVEAPTESLCCMWSTGEETNIFHVDKIDRFRSDILFLVHFFHHPELTRVVTEVLICTFSSVLYYSK